MRRLLVVAVVQDARQRGHEHVERLRPTGEARGAALDTLSAEPAAAASGGIARAAAAAAAADGPPRLLFQSPAPRRRRRRGADGGGAGGGAPPVRTVPGRCAAAVFSNAWRQRVRRRCRQRRTAPTPSQRRRRDRRLDAATAAATAERAPRRRRARRAAARSGRSAPRAEAQAVRPAVVAVGGAGRVCSAQLQRPLPRRKRGLKCGLVAPCLSLSDRKRRGSGCAGGEGGSSRRRALGFCT